MTVNVYYIIIMEKILMQFAFFSECPKTFLSKYKVYFLHQRNKKCNFYFEFIDIFYVFKSFLYRNW